MISPLEQHVLNQIDDAELIRWVQELTRIPSVWKPETDEGEEAAARGVEARCREFGLETHFEFVTPGRPNVIAVLPSHGGRRAWGEGEPRTLMFEGHTDVVTEGDPALWTDPPFSAALRDGRIYGRGANDMKAGLVCVLPHSGPSCRAASGSTAMCCLARSATKKGRCSASSTSSGAAGPTA